MASRAGWLGSRSPRRGSTDRPRSECRDRDLRRGQASDRWPLRPEGRGPDRGEEGWPDSLRRRDGQRDGQGHLGNRELPPPADEPKVEAGARSG